MQIEKKGLFLFSVIGFLFFFCVFTEEKLAAAKNIIWNVGWVARLLSASALLGILTGCMLYLLLVWLHNHMPARFSADPTVFRLTPAAIFGISWALLFLAWLPTYLAYYPAICSYDTTIQMGQIAEHSFNDHHPIIHTLLIGFFYHLGNRFGSGTLGIGLYALVQMLTLSAALAGGIAILRSWGSGKWHLILLLLYGCFFPFHAYLSVSVAKDVYFSAFFLLMILCLWGLLQKGNDCLKPSPQDLFYMILGILIVLFRTNGRFMLLVLLAFLLLACISKQNRKLFCRLALETLLALIAGFFLLNILFAATQAQQGDRREMLSLPIQQLARTMVYHGGEGLIAEDDASMSEKDRLLIRDFILNEAYREYRGEIADPVKRHTNTYVARYRSRDFLSTYLHLFASYPGDYLNAALSVNAGYLSPLDTTHAPSTLTKVRTRDWDISRPDGLNGN